MAHPIVTSVRALRRSAIGLLALAGAGCGGNDSSPPADVHGTYTFTTTNDPSACLPNWKAGDQALNVPVEIAQNGSAITATVTGGAGATLEAVYGPGANVYRGTVEGNGVSAVARGSTGIRSGTCNFFIDATLSATLTGDRLQGTVTYTPNINDPNNADCVAASHCSASQRVDGTRPPT